ncbi:hypothetical protein MMC29_006840 [Sticta canariensis]|nr:hypothetical protein [Sticta canariensis]
MSTESTKSKAELIDERKAALPLPEDPPVASDWNSADGRTTNVGSGGVQSDVSYGNGSDAGLRGPASADSNVRTDGETLRTNTAPSEGVGKNTSDPEAYLNPKKEGPGPVAPDSLAAESVRDGGAFSDNRDGGVSESSSNLVNTEFSSATTLAPTPDATEREAKATWQDTADELKGPGGQKYPEGVGGQGEFPGSHNADGYSGGSTKAKQELLSKAEDSQGTRASGGSDEHGNGGSDTNTLGNTGRGTSSEYPSENPSGTTDEKTERQTSEHNPTSEDISRSSGEPPSSDVPVAPGYIASVTAQPTQSGKPKGKNLTEGGFDDTDDSAANNASFTADIGTENDPGRMAEHGFQRTNAAVAGGGGPRQSEVTGKGQYDVLEGEQSL